MIILGEVDWIDDFFKILDKLGLSAPLLGIIILIFFIILFMVIIYRASTGDEFSIFGKIVLKTGPEKTKIYKELKQAEENLRYLNADAKLKSNLLKDFWAINISLSKLIVIDEITEFNNNFKLLIDFILNTIISNLTKETDNKHRVVIFTPNENRMLKIFAKDGFPPHFNDFSLLIDDSAAGYTFRTGKIYNEPDITKETKIFKSVNQDTEDYFSLACVPIKTDTKTWGVLSIDGAKIGSFSKDDITYLTQFAFILGLIFIVQQRKSERIGREAYEKERKPVRTGTANRNSN